MNEQFKDKVIIVTGSTQGSGAETARLLASRGAKAITICGRQENKGLEVKNQIEKLGTECLYIKADLKNVDDCKKIISETDKKFGTINSLINVAGYTERGTILSATLENYENNYSTSLTRKKKLKSRISDIDEKNHKEFLASLPKEPLWLKNT